MRILPLALIALPFVLTACGGGGGGGGAIGAPPAPTASLGEVYRAEPTGSLIYDPFAIDEAMRGNPDFPMAASNVQGATGVLALATQYGGAPVLRDVRMSLSGDRSVLTLEIQGRGTVNLAVDRASQTGGTWGEFFGGQRITLSNFDNTGRIVFGDTRNLLRPISGDGILGLETSPARMATLTSTPGYAGAFDTLGVPATLTAQVGYQTRGTFAMNLNLDNSTIGGTTSGTITYFNGTNLSNDTGSSGTITGVVSGNGVSGTFSLIGANSTASHSFEGNLYGWDAEEIGGGVISTITGTNGSSTGFGSFRGDLD